MSDKVKCIIRRDVYQGRYGIKEVRDGEYRYQDIKINYYYYIDKIDYKYLESEDIVNIEIERELIDTYKEGN